MKRRKILDEIFRIKRLNESIQSRDYQGDDDYLYDPEYYESKFQDVLSEPDDAEIDPEAEENDFEHGMDLPPNQFHDVPIIKSKSDEPEASERPSIPEKGIHHYDREKTDQLHDILVKGDLEKDMIDEPILQSMIKDFLVKPTADFGHDRRFGKDLRLFGFNKAKRGTDEINPTKDYGYADITPANRTLIDDKDKFHTYVNNLIDIYNKKMIHKGNLNLVQQYNFSNR